MGLFGHKTKTNESGMLSFYYGYHGSRVGNSFKVISENGKTVFKYEDGEHREFGSMEYECRQSLMDDLYNLYKENDKKYRLICTDINEMKKLVSRLYYKDDLFYLIRKYEKVKYYLGFAA